MLMRPGKRLKREVYIYKMSTFHNWQLSLTLNLGSKIEGEGRGKKEGKA